MLTGLAPLGLTLRDAPFDDPDWVFELNYDGFRALDYVGGYGCRLVSRNRHRFDEFEPLTHAVAKSLRAEAAIVDGEIVCVDEHGRSQKGLPRSEKRASIEKVRAGSRSKTATTLRPKDVESYSRAA